MSTEHSHRQSRGVPAVSWALALGVCTLLLVQLGLDFRGAARTIGVTLTGETETIELWAVNPGQPADLAGLEPNDVIVAINGEAAASHRAYDRAAEGFRRSVAETLTVERAGVRFEVEIRPGVPFAWVAWGVNALAALLHLALGLLVLGRSAQDVQTRLAWVLCLAIAFELAMPQSGLPFGFSVAVGALFWLLTGLQFSVELHLSSVIPEPASWLRGRQWLVSLYYAAGLGIGAFLALSWLPALEGLPAFSWPWTEAGSTAISVWLLLWVGGVVALLVTAALRARSANGRQQTLLVLFGVAPWAVLSAATIRWDSLGMSYPAWVAVGEPLMLGLYPIAVFFAISRYRLFNVEVVVRRSLIYTALSTLLILVFYATLGAGGALMSVLFEGRSYAMWVVGVATLVLGLVFSPLRRFLERAIERRFFPERAAMRERLGRLARDLPRQGHLDGMSQALVSGVAEIFACRSVTLMLVERHSKLLASQASFNGSPGALTLMTSQEDPFIELLAERGRALPESEWPWGMTFASWLRDLNFVLVVPVVLGDELTGVLLLGERNSGGELRAEGRELLELLGSHVGTILENARLFETATTDALTGLQRREAVLGELDREIERAVRYRRPLTIAMADLDSFKAINDQHGHLAGDMMLRRAAQTISENLRSTDLVGRFGGEEFLILLPESETMGALQVVEKLRRAIETLRVETDSGQELSITISIGLASIGSLSSSAPLTGEALIEAADRSLYQAKQEGRNRVAVAG